MKALIEKALAENRVVTDALRSLIDKFGYIDPELIPFIAHSYNLSKAEILGVVSFYEDFRTDKPAKHVIRICQAEACQSVGANELLQHSENKTKSLSEPTSIEIGTVSCLGLCACGPALLHNETPYAQINNERFDDLLNSIMATEQK